MKIIKNFCIFLNRLKRRWYPLNSAEIEMINQSFEGYHEVNINEKINIEGVDYVIKKNTKFKFTYTLFVNDFLAYNISIWYDGKNEAIVGCSSVQGPLMGHGHYTNFIKENNRWVNKGTSYWIS